MALGVILSLVVGIGLMALVVLSSRARYDEPAVLIEEPDLDQEEARNRARKSSNKPGRGAANTQHMRHISSKRRGVLLARGWRKIVTDKIMMGIGDRNSW